MHQLWVEGGERLNEDEAERSTSRVLLPHASSLL